MKVILTTIFLIQFSSKVIGQDTMKVIRYYHNDKPKSFVDSIYNSIPNAIFISLNEGFNDSLYITVDDEVVLNRYLKTNGSIGLAGGFVISFKDSLEFKNLKLRFINGNLFAEERLNLSYKSLEIRYRKLLELTYTSHFPMRE